MPEHALPEFTRSLRALAVPSAPGADQDRILAPLIEARAAAHRVTTLEAQVAAFDAARLERAWRDAIAAFAADRFPRSAPDRRALAAELDVLAAPVWASLRRLRDAGTAARGASRDERRAAWERWVAAVRAVFQAADDWWRVAPPILGDPAGRRGVRWRRLLRRGP